MLAEATSLRPSWTWRSGASGGMFAVIAPVGAGTLVILVVLGCFLSRPWPEGRSCVRVSAKASACGGGSRAH